MIDGRTCGAFSPGGVLGGALVVNGDSFPVDSGGHAIKLFVDFGLVFGGEEGSLSCSNAVKILEMGKRIELTPNIKEPNLNDKLMEWDMWDHC